jgi:hypothetical protein
VVSSASSAKAELENARIVDFPLRGGVDGGADPGGRDPKPGTDLLGQRYAFDLVRFDPRKGARSHPAGEVLGRVGHTDNSSAPHLHFQLMDGLTP